MISLDMRPWYRSTLVNNKMTKAKKDAFLILRVEQTFKRKIEKKAKDLGETVSEFIRKALAGRL